MFSPKNALGIFLYVNLISWLLLLAIKVMAYFGFSGQGNEEFNFYLKGLLLNLYLLFIYFYFSTQIEKKPDIHLVETLTRLFILGLITNMASLMIQLALAFLEEPPVSSAEAYWINILYHFNIGLLTIFLTQAFFDWKKMILYHKSPQLVRLWNAFEYLILISLLFNFFEFDFKHPPFAVALIALLVLGLALSFNLKWVAYLNSKEKWQSILLLLFIGIFSYYFFYTVISHSYNPYFTTDLMHSVYVLAMFVFVIFYSIFSLLVILFNLPTSSVLEQKLEEITGFQRLAHSLQNGEKEEQVYEALLESALQSVEADAAWLEILDEDGGVGLRLLRDIEEEEVRKIKRTLQKRRLSQIVDDTFLRHHSPMNSLQTSSYSTFESILTAPLAVNEKYLGSLTLLRKTQDGFDEEKRELIQTFARQASISIENFRLLSKTIEAERLKEEIKIAQRIQQSLLPKDLAVSERLQIEAFYRSAYEVGGDYYDIYKINPTEFLVIIGDVSGKGSTAAFHMAQMKGIFQSLAQLNFPPTQFLAYANQALAKCLEKTDFITVTLLHIDLEKNAVEIAQAGHCPVLVYQHRKRKVSYLISEGLGLGIVRNHSFEHYIHSRPFYFEVGDMILLYTDGIVEARDINNEEYGYERLKDFLLENIALSPSEIIKALIADLEDFGKNRPIHDDHTAVLIQFL